MSSLPFQRGRGTAAMAGGEEACLVCGRLPTRAVQRLLEADSALCGDLLPATLATLCIVCDRLVGRFEELTTERRAVRAELEGRRGLADRLEAVETGEITDVSSFVKDGVKIFEIDVKSEDVVSKIAEQIRKENTANVKKRSRSLKTTPTTAAPRQKKRRTEDLEDSLYKHEEEEDREAPDHESDICDSVDQSFDCTGCLTSFASSGRLAGHKKHCTETADLHCKLCSKLFANKRNLRDHNRVFHDGPDALLETKYSYPCTECEKVFYKKSNLTSHMMRHSSDKPYICGVDNCGKEFKRQKTLMKHIELIHEGKKDELLCVHCGKQFASQSGLRAHVSGHTGVDPVRREVPCPACDKTFRCRADLDSHMVVHSRAKPYACSRCNQAFSQKASLKDHENVHLERFQCGGCGKAFGRERYLKLHCRTCGHLQDAGEAVGEVQHIIISGVGAMADKEGELVQVVQVPESGELAVVHHHGVQLVQRQEEVEQVVHQLVKVEGSAEHVVALVSEEHAFQIVQAENG